jgi:hypothetical protein
METITKLAEQEKKEAVTREVNYPIPKLQIIDHKPLTLNPTPYTLNP